MARQRGVPAPGRQGRQLAERLDKGEPIEAVAAEANAPAKSATDIARRQPKDELTTEAVARIFATPVGKAASAPNGADTRAVFKVTAATVPPLNTTTQQADAIKNRLREALGDTLLEEYIADLQKGIGVTVNRQAMRSGHGGRHLSDDRRPRTMTHSQRPTRPEKRLSSALRWSATC